MQFLQKIFYEPVDNIPTPVLKRAPDTSHQLSVFKVTVAVRSEDLKIEFGDGTWLIITPKVISKSFSESEVVVIRGDAILDLTAYKDNPCSWSGFKNLEVRFCPDCKGSSTVCLIPSYQIPKWWTRGIPVVKQESGYSINDARQYEKLLSSHKWIIDRPTWEKLTRLELRTRIVEIVNGVEVVEDVKTVV